MSPETKAICEMEWAVETCRNWKSASVIELQEACRYVPGAVLLLIRRMSLGFCTPNAGAEARCKASPPAGCSQEDQR